jgi:hypothetical protein
MKRSLMKISLVLIIALVLFALLAIHVLYRSGPVRLDVKSVGDGKGVQVTIQNGSYLPVLVGRCETVSDANNRDSVVGDVIQRWRPEVNRWETLFSRNECKSVAMGVAKATFTRKLLWPSKQLHTAPFFPNVGVAGSPFRHGDKIRFVVFSYTPRDDSGGIASSSFMVE